MKMVAKLAAGLAVLAVAFFALSGFFLNFHLDAPPVQSVTRVNKEAPTSVLVTPIVLELRAANEIANSFIDPKKPVVSGTTEKLALDTIRSRLGLTVQEKVECKPTEAAKLAIRTLECLGGEAFEDLTFLQKTGKLLDCNVEGGIDGVITIFRAADACIEKNVPMAIPDRPTELAYDIYLERFDFSETSGRLQTTAQARVALNPPKSLFDTFVKKPKTTCSVRITGIGLATPTLEIVDGYPRLVVDVDKVTFEPGEPCRNQEPVQTRQIMNEIDETLLDAVSHIFQEKLQGMIEDALNSEDTFGQFAENQTALETALYKAYDMPLLGLPFSASLRLSPESILFSQPRVGVKNGHDILAIAAGMVAKPEIALTPLEDQTPMALGYSIEKFNNEFYLAPVAQVSLDEIGPIATRIARTVLAETLPDFKYDELDLTFYQVDDRIVIGAKFTGVSWLRLSGTVFLTTRPEYDSEQNVLALRDVKFDLDSTQFLTRRAAWVLESPIEALLSERLIFNLGEPFQAMMKKIESLEFGIPFAGLEAVVQIQAKDATLDQTWLSDNRLFVSILAQGAAMVLIK